MMCNKISFVLFFIAAVSLVTRAAEIDGYPIANFAVAANVSANGEFYNAIYRNPGQLGEWLEPQGALKFELEESTPLPKRTPFFATTVSRQFPFAKLDSSLPNSPADAGWHINTFAPLAEDDIDISSLPVFMTEIQFISSDERKYGFNIIVSKQASDAFTKFQTDKHSGMQHKNFQCSVDCPSSLDYKDNGNVLCVHNEPKQKTRMRFVTVFYDEKGWAAKKFKNAEEITEYVYQNWDALKKKTEDFSKKIPQFADKELSEAVRWYSVPGIALTKCTAKGEVLTMGYRELNQRDSFWTSWIHLALFPKAERIMIEESKAAQRQDGKIPTTILPLIERHDDLDINAFFILRCIRYYETHKDIQLLKSDWTAICKAMDWLITRDKGDGIPAQVSFWGDWKDVQGVKDRLYSPFSALLYIASLKAIEKYAADAGAAKEDIEKYAAARKKAEEFVNRPTEEGGLWNGHYYCQRWKDGTVNDKLLQDQTIGIVFDAVPLDRAKSIVDSLDAKSLTPYGIAETFPYYPDSFGYAPATYHNGAVWPWLSFVDCWARVKIGRKDNAVSLIKRVAKADLIDSGDYSPNEHINSLTGKNLGFQLQGWNAGLFGLAEYGLQTKDGK